LPAIINDVLLNNGGYFMSLNTIPRNLLTSFLLWLLSLSIYATVESDSIILYTPYTKIAVPPGQSVEYSIDLINKGTGVVNVDVVLKGLPGSWNYTLKAGGFNIRELSVLPNEKKTINLKVDVPMRVNKGSYHFQLKAGSLSLLPLTITVSEKGEYKTEFTTDQANMQGNNTATFTFQAVLKNRTADQQLYALMTNQPRGWNIVF
jgi:uncharacterized membrane protein